MIDKINAEAFQLTQYITSEPKENKQDTVIKPGSSKEKGYWDITDKVVGPMVGKSVDLKGIPNSIFSEDKHTQIGFNSKNYPLFSTFVQKVHSLKAIKEIVTLQFLETEIFDWFCLLYRNQKAKSTLYNHVMLAINEKVKLFTFYFPVTNLEIEKPFIIGDVEFTFFTKDYWDNYYNSLKKTKNTWTQDSFTQLFRNDFQGQVLAKVSVKAEGKLAAELAKKKAEIATDILKLFSVTTVLPEKKSMFDLNFRLSYQTKSNYLSQSPNEGTNFSLNMDFNNQFFDFTLGHHMSANKSGLNDFSEFSKNREDNELSNLIIQSIQFYGLAISNWDLHLRCISLITIVESIFLKTEEKGNLEQKTKARLSKTLSNNHKEKERIKLVFSSIYQVRHKMIHKALRIEIDINILSEVQRLFITLFINLMDFNLKQRMKNKNELVEELNKIKS